MLVRRDQVDALAKNREAQFVAEMVAHLRANLAPEVAALDDEALRAHVEAGIARARTHGLKSKQDCVRFLNLAATFGWELDQDPARPWIGEYLRDPEVKDPSERLHRVASRCLRELRTEENNRKARAAL
jgi:hypothetical protein